MDLVILYYCLVYLPSLTRCVLTRVLPRVCMRGTLARCAFGRARGPGYEATREHRVEPACMDPSGPVTTDWKKIISTAASDKWIEFGRALLRTSTRQITDITSRLANPSPLAPKDKLVKILERWLSIGAEPAGETERRSRPATRTELKKACQEEKILGGVNRVLKEKYKRGTKELNARMHTCMPLTV